jgi:hypothetical protein
MEKNVKKKKNKIRYNTGDTEEVKNFIVVIIVVALIVACLYLVTRAFVTKDLFTKKEEATEVVTPGQISYDTIVMGQIFQMDQYPEYYVVIYDSTNNEYTYDMQDLVFQYGQKEKGPHMYTVDLSNKTFNGSYYDPENVNVKATKLSEMKVGDITLLHIKKGKVVEYIVDYAKMKKALGLK